MTPRITVVIVNYNSGARLEKCLAHMARQTFADFETIVVDNASSDGSAQAANGAEIPVTLINAGSNLGFAAANNLAAKKARGEWLAFLNPDAYAAPDWLAEFVAAAERYRGVDAFGSAQLNADEPSRIDGAGDVCHAFGLIYRGHLGFAADALPEDGEVFSACAAAAFYRRETFQKLGGFDERFFCYCEDMDLGFRLRLAGGRAVQMARAVVLHEGSGVSGRRSDFTVYHGARNRRWVYYKNAPYAVLLALAPIHLAVDLLMLARAAAGGAGAAYWRGLRDGIAAMRTVRMAGAEARKEKKISNKEIIRLLTWSPVKLMRRAADIRPIRKTL